MKKTYAIIYVNKENKNTIHILLTSSITFSQQKFYVYLPMLEILKVLGIGYFTNSHMKKHAIIYVNIKYHIFSTKILRLPANVKNSKSPRHRLLHKLTYEKKHMLQYMSIKKIRTLYIFY